MLAANLSFAIAGPNGDQAVAVRTDAAGNVYELATDAVYKFSAAGAPVWSAMYTAFGALDTKEGLALDGSGNIYIAGMFSNTASSPAQFGTTSLVSAGFNDGFLAKLDSNGNFLWAESFGGTGGDDAYAVATDGSGNAYLTGDFSGSATFGSGANSTTLTASGGFTDIVAAKFDPSGTLLWANGYGSTDPDAGHGIAVDGQGNAYVTGLYQDTVDFDAAQPGLHKLTTFFPTAFLLKLDTNGGYVWAKQLNANNGSAGDGQAEGDAITVDAAGNIYSTGTFGGPVELNPNGGDLNTAANFVFPDAYVLKLDSSGTFDWAADLHNVVTSGTIGGLQPSDIATDAQGNVYSVGWYDGVANFNPQGQYLKTSAGFDDVYVSELDNQGKFVSASTVGGSGTDQGYGVAVTSAVSGVYVYAAGTFSGTVDFNSGFGPADNVTANGVWDGFLWGLNSFGNSIAGVVWDDQNGDGLRQSAEPGVPGVNVSLFAGSPGSGTQVATTTTDALGLYSFHGVGIGQSYYVQVGGAAFAAKNAGPDPTIDSNVSATTGESDTFTLLPGQSVMVNAGLSQASPPLTVNMAFGVTTIGFTEGSSIVADSSGNIYFAGSFDGDTTFGSGAGAVTLRTGANNDFVAKYSANGVFLWVRQIVSSYWEYDPKIGLDAAGNLYVAGELTNSATIGSLALPASDTTTTAFLAKLDKNGNTLWATTSVVNGASYSVSMAVDSAGNAYLAGGFKSTATVNTTPNTTTLTSNGGYDAFIVKYSANGKPQWAKNYGGLKDDAVDSVAIDPQGNPVITGSFKSTAQFGGTTLASGSSFGNDFVAKLSASDGSVVWADALTCTVTSGPEVGGEIAPSSRIVVDSSGNVYSTGSFEGIIQLDPTGGSDSFNGTNASFISKLDANGNFVWGKAFTADTNGYDVDGYGIALDSKGDVYTTGRFARTENFNPNGAPAQNLTAIGASYDVYISQLDSNGNYVNALQFGGSGEDEGTAIFIDANNTVYATGLSIGPSAFGSKTVGAKNDQDIFVVRLANTFGSLANVAPSFAIQGPQQAVGLNAPPQIVPGFAGKIVPGLPGEINEIANFTVTTNNDALFAVPPQIDESGTLTYTPAAGAAGTAIVTVVLRNDGGTAHGGSDTSAPQTFPITVDVNQPPSFAEGANQSVNENSGLHRVSSWAKNISAGPPSEAAQTVTFSVVADNTGLFSTQPAIDPLTGDLSYMLATDVFGTATVTVLLSDNGGTANGGVDKSSSQTFTIKVNLVNHAPSFTAGGDQTVNENAGSQTVSAWATGITAGPQSESAQALNFIVSTDNDALFSVPPTIDPLTGALSYTPALDVSGVAHVSVQLRDDGGIANGGADTSAAQSFTINVNFVNQAPSFAVGPNLEVQENGGTQVAPNWATSISSGAPQEAGQTLNFIVRTDNDALFAGTPTIDPATGLLIFTPATDTFGVATVTVQLHDNGGTANEGADTSPPQTFTIKVDLLNHAPSFSAGPSETVNENAGPQTVAGWATNLSAGPASEAQQALNFVVTTTNNALFASQPEIDAAGDLTYTPATDQSGVATVTVALHDNGGTAFDGVDTSASQTFTITVNFVNQPPTFVSAGDQTVHETPGPQTVSAWATNVSSGAATEAGQQLSFSISTDNDSLFSSLPAIDLGTGTLTYTPAVYAVGVAHVTVTLDDDGGTNDGGINTSVPHVFTITVTPSNQAPTFMPGGDQVLRGSYGRQTVAAWATNILSGPPRENNQSIQFLVSTDNDALFNVLPAVDPNTGDLTYTPVLGASGQAHVTLRLHDNGGVVNGGVDTSAPVTFLISITYVNQAPSFTRGPDDAVDENSGPESLPGWATNIIAGPPNELAQSLNFVATTDNDALFAVSPTIDPVTGDLTYTPAANANGVAHVTVTLHDNGGVVNGGQDTSIAQTFTITVNAVNQAPFFTGGPNLLLRENEGVRTFTPWATGISTGAANEASQTLDFRVSTDDDALFSSLPAIDPATGNLTFTTAHDATGVANVTIQLLDDGGTDRGGHDASSPYTFTVTVTTANQPPSFIAGGDQTAKENAGVQAVPGWATSIYPGAPIEAGQVLRFIVSTDNPGLFSAIPTIDAHTGDLTYAPAPDASGVAHLTVQLYDDGGILNDGADISPQQNFTIAVTYVNDAPSFVIAGDPPAVNENSGPQAVANFATSISPSGNSPAEANEAKQAVHFNVTDLSITSGSATPTTFFTTPPTIDANGTLTYQVAPEVSGSAQVTVDLQDDGGTADGGSDTSPAQTFTIAATFINEAPRFTHHGPDQVVAEDSGTTSVAGWATSAPGNGDNEANQHVSYQVTTANPALFTAAGQPAIDASGTLTFTPAPQVTGTTSVTVIAKDDGGTANGGIDQSPPIKFHIEIDPANHAPTIANAIAPVVVNEGAADQIFSLAGVFDDLDVDLATGDHLTLSLAGNSNAKLVTATLTSADPATGNLILHIAPNQAGTATIDLVATDQTQATVDAPIVITVNSIPTFTAGPDQHVPLGSGPIRAPAWATAILAASANETGESLSFQTTVTSTTNPALFAVAPAIDANGNLTFTPASGQLGQATVTVTLHDSGAAAGSEDSVPHVFTIEVDAAPVAQDHTFVVSTSASNSVAANVGAMAGDTSTSGLPLTARLISAPTNGSVQFNADGSFTYTKGSTFAGLDSFSYQLTDGLAASNVATVNIISYEATIVTKLYQQVLNRVPDTQGLEHWVGLIEQGQPYSVIAQGIFESNERLNPIIQGYYQQFLQRTADATGLMYWSSVWRGFGGPEPVVAGLIGSPEFYASAGQAKPSLSPNAAWVTALYERLLNREPDQDGLQYWTNQLDGGTQDRLGVVNGFENSVEHFQNVTIALYQQYLNRQPTADELSNNVAAFEAGATQRTIQIKLIDSTEYRNSPPPPALGSADQLS